MFQVLSKVMPGNRPLKVKPPGASQDINSSVRWLYNSGERAAIFCCTSVMNSLTARSLWRGAARGGGGKVSAAPFTSPNTTHTTHNFLLHICDEFADRQVIVAGAVAAA